MRIFFVFSNIPFVIGNNFLILFSQDMLQGVGKTMAGD